MSAQHLQSPHSPSTAKPSDDEDRSHDTPVQAGRYAAPAADHLETAEALVTAAERRIALPSALAEVERLVIRGMLGMASKQLDLAGEGNGGALVDLFPERFNTTSDRIGRALDELDA